MLTKSYNNKKNLTPLKIFERNDRNGNQTKFSYFKCRVCFFFLSFISVIVFRFSFKDNSSLSIFNVRSSWQLEKHFFFFSFFFFCLRISHVYFETVNHWLFWTDTDFGRLKKKKTIYVFFFNALNMLKRELNVEKNIYQYVVGLID
jgi:hypothetical protein